MSRYRKPSDLAAINHINATFTATNIAPTLAALQNYAGGYPAATPGAAPLDAAPTEECHSPLCTNTRPCELHGDGVQLTAVERLAGQTDLAIRDLGRLVEALTRAAHHEETAARICAQWGLAGIDQTTIAAGITAIDRDTFGKKLRCVHCSRPRLDDRTECSWCRDFRLEFAYPPPQQVIDIRERRQTIRFQDITPWMDRIHPDWRKKAKKLKGKVA